MSDSPASNIDAPTVHDPHAGRRPGSLDANNLPCRFAGYELIEEVARGGMGVVFRAKQLDLNRTVAIKMIINGCLADPEDIKRFQAEAESAANLDHPGIVPIYEVGDSEGRHFFSMAFVEGKSLAQVLAAGPLDYKRAAALLAQIADAVDYAHDQGIIHRDLKPGNVLLDEYDRPRITDFGVAKQQLADREDITIKGELLGTPNFMPPEQARGDTDQVTMASDVYSLGAILYTTLTGRPPFQSANQLDTLNQVIHDPVIAPRKLNSKIPFDLETITLKCLEKQPLRRYQTAKEVGNELRAFLVGKPIQARPPGLVRILDSWFRQHMLVASMSGVTSVLLVAGLVGLAWRCRFEIERNATLQTQVLQLEQQNESFELAGMVLNARVRRLLDDDYEKLFAKWQPSHSERLAFWAARESRGELVLSLKLITLAFESLPRDSAVDDTYLVAVLDELLVEAEEEGMEELSLAERVALARKLSEDRELTEQEKRKYRLEREDS